MNPEGISSSSPGWRFSANPGEKRNQIRNPEKGCVGFEYCLTAVDATPSGLDLSVLPVPQGWLKNANPGLED
jgi:hypothetical protein